MRYFQAAAASIGIFVLYAVACGILGLKNGGGIIPMILLFAAIVWTSKNIIGTKREEE